MKLSLLSPVTERQTDLKWSEVQYMWPSGNSTFFSYLLTCCRLDFGSWRVLLRWGGSVVLTTLVGKFTWLLRETEWSCGDEWKGGVNVHKWMDKNTEGKKYSRITSRVLSREMDRVTELRERWVDRSRLKTHEIKALRDLKEGLK